MEHVQLRRSAAARRALLVHPHDTLQAVQSLDPVESLTRNHGGDGSQGKARELRGLPAELHTLSQYGSGEESEEEEAEEAEE